MVINGIDGEIDLELDIDNELCITVNDCESIFLTRNQIKHLITELKIIEQEMDKKE